MEDLKRFVGAGQFGAAYEYMFTHDAMAQADAVDHRVIQRMVRLCPETAAHLYRPPADVLPYRRGTRPLLEARLAAMMGSGGGSPVAGVTAGCAAIAQAADALPDHPLDGLRLGGTEEEIAARGSSWCSDLARLACRLLQVAGVPARLVTLADPHAAYCGHQAVEAWYDGAWPPSIRLPTWSTATPTGTRPRRGTSCAAPTWSASTAAETPRRTPPRSSSAPPRSRSIRGMRLAVTPRKASTPISGAFWRWRRPVGPAAYDGCGGRTAWSTRPCDGGAARAR